MLKIATSFLLLILLSSIGLVCASCTSTGGSSGAALSDGYLAPQSGSAVDQTESMRSQYREWVR